MRISDWSSDVCSSDLLGGAVTHTGKSGVADLAFEDDIEALIQLRRFMEFLPASNRETPPVLPTEAPLRSREMSLDTLVPANPNLPYYMQELIGTVVDAGDVFQLYSNYAGNITPGFPSD